MEERAGERRHVCRSPRDIPSNRTTLSPALSRSFVAGEGEDRGQCTDAPVAILAQKIVLTNGLSLA
jgi:hypothetical protein